MDDLVRWLGEQLDEDERIAWAATRGPWCALHPDGAHGWTVGIVPHDPAVGIAHLPSRAEAAADAEHIVEHDPARVLREIDAKRRMVDEVLAYEAKIDGEWGCCHGADEIAAGQCPEIQPTSITALRLLALPYADRPSYREEWAP